MTEVSQLAQILATAGMMKPQVSPPLLADQGQRPPDFLSLLQRPGPTPEGAIRELNPGLLWGGRDQNVMQPFDVQRYRTYGGAGESL